MYKLGLGIPSGLQSLISVFNLRASYLFSVRSSVKQTWLLNDIQFLAWKSFSWLPVVVFPPHHPIFSSEYPVYRDAEHSTVLRSLKPNVKECLKQCFNVKHQWLAEVSLLDKISFVFTQMRWMNQCSDNMLQRLSVCLRQLRRCKGRVGCLSQRATKHGHSRIHGQPHAPAIQTLTRN